MTMNDWSVFVRALSPYLLHTCGAHEDVLKLWAPLRKATVYFLDYREGQHCQSLVDKAQDWLGRYARLAERMVPKRNLNTNQLHQCVFHLPTSVRLWGPDIFRSEFWVERMMQLVKRVTKYRTMCSPELVACGAWLLKHCIAAGAAEDPELLATWSKIDPMTIRFTPPDNFDRDGNTLTHKVADENGPDSAKVMCSMFVHPLAQVFYARDLLRNTPLILRLHPYLECQTARQSICFQHTRTPFQACKYSCLHSSHVMTGCVCAER